VRRLELVALGHDAGAPGALTAVSGVADCYMPARPARVKACMWGAMEPQ
jgi:hypothetical protein